MRGIDLASASASNPQSEQKMHRLKYLLAFIAAGFALNGFAHEGPEAGQEKRELLQHRALSDAPGKLGILATVHYAPGQVSLAHEHPGSVFAYVLEGEVTSQMEGSTPVTYRAGESWYERPHAGHLVSENASKTKPATLVVFLLTNEGEEISKPR